MVRYLVEAAITIANSTKQNSKKCKAVAVHSATEKKQNSLLNRQTHKMAQTLARVPCVQYVFR